MMMRATAILSFFLLPFLIADVVHSQDDALPAPKAKRHVVVNLSVDKPDDRPKLKLKVKGGAVVAETPDNEKLEYEVAISGPGGESVAYLPVPANSPVHVAYVANKDDAQKVVFGHIPPASSVRRHRRAGPHEGGG